MEEMHIFVSGIVQGVGFRAAMKKLAMELQITGYVRNLPDGRVEICAQGTSSQLSALLKAVQEKPGVDQVATKPRRPGKLFGSFEIVRES